MISADYTDFKLRFANLLNLKQQLKRTQMRILFAGVSIQDMRQFADYEYDNLVSFHLRNYSQLDVQDLKWLDCVN